MKMTFEFDTTIPEDSVTLGKLFQIMTEPNGQPNPASFSPQPSDAEKAILAATLANAQRSVQPLPEDPPPSAETETETETVDPRVTQLRAAYFEAYAVFPEKAASVFDSGIKRGVSVSMWTDAQIHDTTVALLQLTATAEQPPEVAEVQPPEVAEVQPPAPAPTTEQPTAATTSPAPLPLPTPTTDLKKELMVAYLELSKIDAPKADKIAAQCREKYGAEANDWTDEEKQTSINELRSHLNPMQ